MLRKFSGPLGGRVGRMHATIAPRFFVFPTFFRGLRRLDGGNHVSIFPHASDVLWTVPWSRCAPACGHRATLCVSNFLSRIAQVRWGGRVCIIRRASEVLWSVPRPCWTSACDHRATFSCVSNFFSWTARMRCAPPCERNPTCFGRSLARPDSAFFVNRYSRASKPESAIFVNTPVKNSVVCALLAATELLSSGKLYAPT